MTATPPPPRVLHLGPSDHADCEARMRAFTAARDAATPDEIWLTEHPPVYTLGVAGRAGHVLAAGDIPVRRSDRGGQVTYHGPGQVVAYPLVDLRRLGITVREYVFRIETAVLQVLAGYGLSGHRVAGAPGVYLRLADPAGHAALTGPGGPGGPGGAHDALRGLGKVAALGIKVSRHCAYHGVALNVAMDLEPYTRIDPCGYPGLRSVDLARLGVSTTWDEAAARLAQRLCAQFVP
jgi:lipoyl(octanoyl) transferase